MNGFLIIGGQRSGTSLLTRILNQHSQLAVPPESFYFNTFIPLLGYYGDLEREANVVRLVDDVLSTPKVSEWPTRPTRDQVLGRLNGRHAGGVFVALLESWAENQGKTIWGEKTPHHVFHWEEIERFLPGIPVVHIVRDGRDVALGLIRARFGPKSTYAAARRWKRWMDQIDRIRESFAEGRYHQITYEDLLREPDVTIDGICRFLGLEFEAKMLDFHRDQSLYSGYTEDHANLQKPLLTDKVAAWRRDMHPANVAVFESICGDALERYGYPVDSEPEGLGIVREAYLKWIDHPPRKVLAMLRNRQGHREEARLLWMRLRLISRFLAAAGRP